MHDGRIAVNFVHFLLEAINVHPQGPSAIEWACEFLARQVGGNPQARHQGITERTCFEHVDRRRRKTTFPGHDRLHRRLPEAGKQVTNRVTISVQTSPKLAESASTPLARPLSENSPFRPNPKVIRPESGWLGRQEPHLRKSCTPKSRDFGQFRVAPVATGYTHWLQLVASQTNRNRTSVRRSDADAQGLLLRAAPAVR